jgi:hypothetical protein
MAIGSGTWVGALKDVQPLLEQGVDEPPPLWRALGDRKTVFAGDAVCPAIRDHIADRNGLAKRVAPVQRGLKRLWWAQLHLDG